MLDALLSALPDAAYFEQRDFGAGMCEKLRASDVLFAGYLRGAAVWGLAAHPVYPVYSINKTKTEDNVEIHVGYRSAVLSSVETGVLLVLPIKDESGKMPGIAEAKPARATSKRPRTKPIPRMITGEPSRRRIGVVAMASTRRISVREISSPSLIASRRYPASPPRRSGLSRLP